MVEEEARSDEIKTLEELNHHCAKINGHLKDRPYKLCFVEKKELVFLEKNARFMTNIVFTNLVNNIKRDKQLASVPLLYKRPDGMYIVLSGNHRLQAAIAAGEVIFMALYIDKELTRSEQVAIQLSHNSLEGQDDKAILKELFDEIDNIDMKFYSGLDDLALDEIPEVDLPSLKVPSLEYRTIAFVFLPEEADRLQECFDSAMNEASASKVYTVRYREFERLISSLSEVEAAHEIKAPSLAMMYILDVYQAHRTDLGEAWAKELSGSKRRVPFSSIVGNDMIPVGDAHNLKRAIEKMKQRKEFPASGLDGVLGVLTNSYLSKEK